MNIVINEIIPKNILTYMKKEKLNIIAIVEKNIKI